MRAIIFDGAQFMTLEDYIYLLSMREQYQASIEYKLPDVPTDEELGNLPKDSLTFDCSICLETVPLNTVYTLNCDHQVCCPCARNLTSKNCPFCRADISSVTMTTKRIKEVEAKFAQLDQDEAFARNLQAQLNGEEYFNSDAETVVGNPSNNDEEDDVVFIETKKSVSTEVTTKTVFHRRGNLKDDTEAKSKPVKRARSDTCSGDEWQPSTSRRVASKKSKGSARKAQESDDDEFIDF